ncbi:MAG: DUF2628 domain-containing protein [Oscillospiraceae bacterium]|nr:DUF2628 domain-containing protein [Oscillospiraceae bacterium]
MFCHKCGSQSKEGAAFCNKCGVNLIVKEQPSNAQEEDFVPKSVAIPEPEPHTPVEAIMPLDENLYNGANKAAATDVTYSGEAPIDETYGGEASIEGLFSEETSEFYLNQKELLKDLIGRNSDYYLNQFEKISRGEKSNFNMAAFLFAPIVLLYRKQYSYFTKLILPYFILSLVSSIFGGYAFTFSNSVMETPALVVSGVIMLYSLIVCIICGKNFNNHYRKSLYSTIAGLRMNTIDTVTLRRIKPSANVAILFLAFSFVLSFGFSFAGAALGENGVFDHNFVATGLVSTKPYQYSATTTPAMTAQGATTAPAMTVQEATTDPAITVQEATTHATTYSYSENATLDQTYTNGEEGFSINYPSGWSAVDSSELTADEARGILQTWIDNHAFAYDTYINYGENDADDGYLFKMSQFRDQFREFGFVRVDLATGELFWAYPGEEDIPLDDWYNKNYGASQAEYPGMLLYKGVPVSWILDSSVDEVIGALGSPMIFNEDRIMYRENGHNTEFSYNNDGQVYNIYSFNLSAFEIDGVTLDKNRNGLISILGNTPYEGNYGNGYEMNYSPAEYFVKLELGTPEDAAWGITIGYADGEDAGDDVDYYQREVLYDSQPILNWLGARLADLRIGFGAPDFEGVVWEGGTYGYNYDGYNGVTFNKSQYGEDIEAIWGSPAALMLNGATLDKNREELIGLFGTPAYEGWIDNYGENVYFIRFYYQGAYSISFDLFNPYDKAHEFWIYYADDDHDHDDDDDDEADYVYSSGIPDNQVENERLRIRDIWQADRAKAENGTYRKHTVAQGIIAYSDKGQIKLIEVAKKTNGIDYSRVYLFEEGDLVFAYFESSNDAHRMYFYKENMFRWGYTPDVKDTSTTVNYDNREDMLDFREMQNFALSEAWDMYSRVRF